MIQRWVLAFALTASLAASPVVQKIDPPNWWIGFTLNPVRLLIHGSGLSGARVEAADDGLSVIGPVRVNARGTYLFVDVKVLRGGSHLLRVVTSDGSASVPFQVMRQLPRAGRFQGFSPNDLIYLIMPDRFANGDVSNDDPEISKGLYDRSKARYYHGGDLQGIIDHLSYLKGLGATAIWLNPVYDNVNHLNEREKYDGQAITDYHGYGAVDFYGVDEHLGTLAKLRELSDNAHHDGLKIILDMVANHTGPYHPWVLDPPTPTWFHGTAGHHLKETWQTWTLMDPHAPVSLRESTLNGWFADILPDLNQNDPEVKRYLIQNALWWIASTGLDGIRMDTLPYVPRAFWRDWMAAIKREYPNFRVVGEMFDGDPAVVSFFQGGRKQFDGIDTGVDALFDFPQYYAIRHAFAEGKPIREVANTLAHDWLYPNPNELVTFLGLHDVARFMNEPGVTVAGMKLAWTYLLTSRGIPMIYYGDEIGMKGGNDPDNRRDFPGGWKGDPRNAFTPNGRSAEEQEVFDRVQRLAHLRQSTRALRRGRMLQLEAGEQTDVYARQELESSIIVVINNGSLPAQIDCDVRVLGAIRAASRGDLLGEAPSAQIADGRLRVKMPGRTAGIYRY